MCYYRPLFILINVMKNRLNLVLLLIVAVLLGWWLSFAESENNGLTQLLKKEGTPEYTGQKMTVSMYDLQGKPQYFAEAKEIKRYESSQRTEFIEPLLNLFDLQTGKKLWKVTAALAEISKEKMLNLKGNVKLEALDPQSRLQKIETDNLTIDLETQDIRSNAPVKSLGQGFTSQGIGLVGNLKQQVATLQKEVKTYLEPTVIPSQNDGKNKDKQ